MKEKFFDELLASAFALADRRGVSAEEVAVMLRVMSDVLFVGVSAAPRNVLGKVDEEFAALRPLFEARARKVLLDRGLGGEWLKDLAQ